LMKIVVLFKKKNTLKYGYKILEAPEQQYTHFAYT